MDFSFYFPPEYLRAGLLVSLLSVWLLGGLLAYLNHYVVICDVDNPLPARRPVFAMLGIASARPDLPAVAAPRAALPVEKPRAQPPLADILVLDDETVLAEMLEQILSYLGHHCTLCHSPVQALAQLQQRNFDLILSDFRMPVMDGQEFFRRVAEVKPALASKIVFLTGDLGNEDTQAFLASVGNAYISKPFQLAEVKATVTRVLREGAPDPAKELCCAA